MAELIAVGIAQVASADFTVLAGSPVTLTLKDNTTATVMPLNCNAAVQIKSGTQYVTIGTLTEKEPIKVLAASGVFRVNKNASVLPFGVDTN